MWNVARVSSNNFLKLIVTHKVTLTLDLNDNWVESSSELNFHRNVDDKAEFFCMILWCVCVSWAEGESKLVTKDLWVDILNSQCFISRSSIIILCQIIDFKTNTVFVLVRVLMYIFLLTLKKLFFSKFCDDNQWKSYCTWSVNRIWHWMT